MKRRAIVLGGTSGYGQGAAEALRKDNWHVIVAGRSTGTDVREYGQVALLFEHLAKEGPLHAVVYSAGLARGKATIEDGHPEDWAQVFETNALGLMHVAKAAIPLLKETQGHLFSIGSIATEIAYAGAGDYCASKVAQTRVMQTLRYELLGTGIRQTSLEVGLGNTDFQRRRYDGDMEKAASHYGGIKQLEPEDVGNTILWLLRLPAHVNVDSMTIKPLGQAHHGHLAKA